MRVKMEKVKGNVKGITLIALVIMIIVLLILAGITISALSGENGIIQKAVEARTQTDIANVKEQARLDITELQMDKLGEEITEEELETILLKYGSFEESENEKDILDRILTTEKGNKIQVSDIYNGNFNSSGGTPIKMKINTGDDGNVILPINKVENCTIDWGDGQKTENISGNLNSNMSHKYTENNVEKTVTISGSVKELNTFVGEEVDLYPTAEKVLEIEQWGETGLESVILDDCTNLRKIASPSKNSFANLLNYDDKFSKTLCFTAQRCISLTEIPSDLFKYCDNAIGFEHTFAECTGLRFIPEELFANCPNAVSFEGTFFYCTSLTSIPQKLFDNCQEVEKFFQTFYNCTNLTGKPIELWTRGTNNAENEYQGNPNGFGCYYNCTKLDGYEAIPSSWTSAEIIE